MYSITWTLLLCARFCICIRVSKSAPQHGVVRILFVHCGIFFYRPSEHPPVRGKNYSTNISYQYRHSTACTHL